MSENFHQGMEVCVQLWVAGGRGYRESRVLFDLIVAIFGLGNTTHVEGKYRVKSRERVCQGKCKTDKP